MQKFEYKTECLSIENVQRDDLCRKTSSELHTKNIDDFLNHWGEHGWELVSAVGTEDFSGERHIVLIMKRHKEILPEH